VRERFDPSSTGVKSAFVTVAAPGTPDATVGLAGTGVQTDLSRSPTSLEFGSQDIDDGPTAFMQSTLTNSGTQTITLDSPAISVTGTNSADFQALDDDPADCRDGLPLTPGQSCKLRVQFDPATVNAKSAVLTVNSHSGAAANPPVTVDLSGTGIQTQLTPSPSSFAFGKQDIDNSATDVQDSTVTNTGTQPVTLASFSDTGEFQRLTGGANDCSVNQTLAANEACHVRVQFDPSTVGVKSASLTIASNAPSVAIALSGEGTQTELSRAPATLSFGNKDIDEGATPAQESTVTNSGTEDVTISTVDVSTHFVQLTDQGTDCTPTKLLHAGDTCKLRLAFNPASTGSKTGSATVHSNAADVSVALDGTGIQTQLSLSPDTQAFGKRDIDDGPTTSMSSTVTNSGTQAVTLTGIDNSDPGDFVRQTGAGECSNTTSLNAGQSCTLTYTFDPVTVGNKSATVTVSSNAADVGLTLSGEGTQTELSRAPTSLAFGGQDVDSGPSTTMTSVVTNSGTEPVSLSSVTKGGSDPGEFVRLTSQGTDCSSTTVLTAGQTCDVRMQFDPSTKGDKTATVTVSSNAAAIAIDLTGTGKETRLSRAPTSLAFGSKDIDDGATAAQESTITNVGTEDVTIGSVGITGTGTTHFVRLTDQTSDCSNTTTLQANETCKVRIQFNPSTVGAKTATATVSANGVDQNIDLTGTGIQTELSRAPDTLSFGPKDIDDGATAAQFSTVTNSGTEPVTISGVAVTGDFAQATGDSTDCVNGKLLNASDTCKVRVTFDPGTVGAKTGSATVHSNAADISVALDGSGTQTELSRAPDTLSFGSKDIDDGATVAQSSTVTNSGTEPVTISGVAVTGDFGQVTGDSTDCVNGKLLNASGTCKVRVAFDPASTGPKTGTATVHSNAADVSVALDGTGIQTELARAPTTISFGKKDIDDGATAAQESTVTNSGTQDVTLTGVAVTGDFAQATVASGDCTNGTLLHAAGTCKLRATFDPGARGARTGSATVQSNAADVSVALDGTGTQTELSRAPASLTFAGKGVNDGATGAKTSTVTNTGTEDVTVGSVDTTGDFSQATDQSTDCTPTKVLHANGTCDLRVRFDPTTTGSRTGTATLHSNAADIVVNLSGTGIATDLTASPSTIAFGKRDVDDGPSGALQTTITNTGPDNVKLGTIGISGDYERLVDPATSDCLEDQTLAPNDTCRLRARFDPTSTGARTGTFTVPASGGESITIDLTGTGTQTAFTRGVGSISAGSQDIDDGPTTPQASTFTNTGTEDVTITSVDVTGEFGQATGDGGDCSAGRVVHGGEVCQLRVQFDPSSVGSKTGTATLHSSVGNFTVALDGTGIQTSLAHDPTAIDFGIHDVGAGATAIKESTVSNTGTQPVSISDIQVGDTGTAQFLRVSGAPSDCVAGATLNAGETCKLRAMFVPRSEGAKSATITLTSSGGVATLVLSGTGRPRLTLPKLTVKASSTKKRRLTVNVTPVGGTVRTIVVEVRSGSGKLLGTGTLSSASRKKPVTVKLKAPLKRGSYSVTGRGRDALGNAVTAARQPLKVR
jgi:hypothetical protein